MFQIHFKLYFWLIVSACFYNINVATNRHRSYDSDIDFLRETMNNIFTKQINGTSGASKQQEYNMIENPFIINPKCENIHLKSDFESFLKVQKNSPLKNQLLKEFLCMKFFQYYDLISYLSIEEYRESLIQFRILKFVEHSKKIVQQRTDSCSMENVAHGNINGVVSICPWYWRVFIRDDKYPYEISVATCNCLNCQATTVFDSDIFKLSKCNLIYRLSPVLVKETNRVEQDDDYEAWFFNLEEIPVSCTCELNINPY